MFGHVHNYERTCSIYKGHCKGLPSKDETGIDTYDHRNYSAPVQAIIGMAGFSLDQFPSGVSLSLRLTPNIYTLQVRSSLFFTWNWTLIKQVHNTWSLSRIPEYGYLRGHATKTDIKLEVSIPVNLRLKLILHSIYVHCKSLRISMRRSLNSFTFFFFMVSVCKCGHKKSSGQLPDYKSIS